MTNVGTVHLRTCQPGEGGIGGEKLEAVADRGYFNGEESACDEAGITVTLPTQTSEAKSEGRRQAGSAMWPKRTLHCPAGEKLIHRSRTRKKDWSAPLRSNACRTCARRPVHEGTATPHTRWEHEHVAMPCRRADKNPDDPPRRERRESEGDRETRRGDESARPPRVSTRTAARRRRARRCARDRQRPSAPRPPIQHRSAGRPSHAPFRLGSRRWVKKKLMHRSKLHRYSITSSARPDSGSGTAIPSSFAALALMKSSSLVPCWTGRSAGFSPLRMRPT